MNPVLSVTNACPIVLEDQTDYFANGTQWTYQPIELSAPSLADGVFEVTSVLVEDPGVDTVAIFNDPVEGIYISGNLTEPLAFYQTIVNKINDNPNFSAVLDSTDANYRNWVITISYAGSDYSAYDVIDTQEINNSVVFPTLSSSTRTQDGEGITARNLALFDPCGNQLDLGGVAQQDKFLFDRSQYFQGDTFTFTVCSSTVVYEVENAIEERDCVVKGLIKKINESTDASINVVCASQASDGDLLATASIAGVPFMATINFFEAAAFTTTPLTKESITANTSTLTLDYTLNSVSYTAKEVGGKYRAVLTLYTDNEGSCSYDVIEEYFSNWCYDVYTIQCCLVDLVNKYICECPDKAVMNDTSSLRNKLEAINIMIDTGYSYENIQLVVDSAKSICNKCNCGSTDTTTNCGCGGSTNCGCNG